MIRRAAPFWISIFTLLITVGATLIGGWWALVPLVANYHLASVVDRLTGEADTSLDENTPREALWAYHIVLKLWPVFQVALFIWFFWYVPQADHLSLAAKVMLAFGLAGNFGLVGITYAHELMHRRNAWDTWRADILLGCVAYGPFRTEHLLGHHIFVATPKDPVTARYNEGFWTFFPRAVRGTFASAWEIETRRLTRQNRPWWHGSNPFYRYAGLGLLAMALSLTLGGFEGLGLWAIAAFGSILSLELTNYIEHYGLERRKLPNGKYEPTRPHHSWNCDLKFSNWLLINLQRHSDHHFKPERPFAVLQTYDPDTAPVLPYGYTRLGMIALWPRRWRKVMNPQVRAWRKQFYPDAAQWPICE